MTFPSFDDARKAAELLARSMYEHERAGFMRDFGQHLEKWEHLPPEHRLIKVKAAVDAIPDYEQFRSEHATEGLR